MTPTVRLHQQPDRVDWIRQVADQQGSRVGLSGLLGDLDAVARVGPVPVSTARYGFSWAAADGVDQEWWPQGITTSADARDSGEEFGRSVVVVGWYAKKLAGTPSHGSRVSVVDVTDEDSPRYRHVRLVQPRLDEKSGVVGLEPVRVHAGGIGWYGSSLLVADTHGGIRVFGWDDVLRLDGDPHDGCRYVLPQRTSFRAVADEGTSPFRFSFLSVDRSQPDHRLVMGEYGAEGQTRRLASCSLDPTADGSLADGAALELREGLPHSQGVLRIGDSWYVSTSRGRFRRGGMRELEESGGWREHAASLAVGCEDLAYWPQRDEIWSCSEYPGHRFVYAMPRSNFSSARLARLRSRLKALWPPAPLVGLSQPSGRR
ncbi:MAG: hypothetical protein ACR2LE_10760 [Nocardioidaceae bacterium]